MISDFADFCLWTYTIVDDIWVGLAPWFKRPGPAPLCSDSELLTLAIVGECRGWDLETELLSNWQEHRNLFPILPSQSRFNRRRRHLRDAFNLVRRAVLSLLDVAQDSQGVIDSLPVPVMGFHLVPGAAATATWKSDGATFGKVPTKKETIFGYKLHLLLTLGGVILDFELAPAHAADLTVGAELLAEHTALDVTGDKGYRSEPIATALREERGITLRTLPRRNEVEQVSATTRRLLNHVRQIVETVNAQLTEQFHVEINHAHTFVGLCTRLLTKLAAHTLCIYLNRLLGNPAWLQIKALAFPK
jgi:transposase